MSGCPVFLDDNAVEPTAAPVPGSRALRRRTAGLLATGLLLTGANLGCVRRPGGPILDQDHVLTLALTDIRLGDSVPLELSVTVRWRVERPKEFLTQFNDAAKYGEAVLKPRAREVANRIANGYPSVDAVFATDRQRFVSEMKEALRQGLGEKIIVVKEVVLADVVFPTRFTEALEQVALKEREIEAIRQKSVVDLETAQAAARQAEADGQVEIRQAEVDGRVAEINAKTEDKKRASEMARAETESQVAERRAHAEALRTKVLAEAEAARQRELNRARQEDLKATKDLEVQKQRDLDLVALEKDKAVAQLCAGNPAYASFLINRELASKVQIAVVPVGADTALLNGLLQSSAVGRSK